MAHFLYTHRRSMKVRTVVMQRVKQIQLVFAALLCLVATPITVLGDILDRIGVMGDSLSSEFVGGLSTQVILGSSYTPYKNWVEQLVESRGLDFGPYGYHGFNQRQGYQYNQASVFNVDTTRLLSQGQHTNLANFDPTLALLFVGGNDFFFHAQEHNLPAAFFGGDFDGEDPASIVPDMLSRYRQAVETVAGTAENPTGTQMVLGTAPDVTRAPIAVALANSFFPGSFAQYRSATDAFNDGIMALASERDFAVLDINDTLDQMIGQPGDLQLLSLGGNSFNLAFQSPSAPTDLFLHDGFHPNSIGHGLLAQQFIVKVNQHYGTQIEPLTDREIVLMAGLEFSTVPEPSIPTSLAIVLVVCCQRRRRN